MSVYFMRMGAGGPIKIGHAKDAYGDVSLDIPNRLN